MIDMPMQTVASKTIISELQILCLIPPVLVYTQVILLLHVLILHLLLLSFPLLVPVLRSAIKSAEAIFLKVRVSESFLWRDPFLWLLVEHLQNDILGLPGESLECIVVHIRLLFLDMVESCFSVL